jgi:hypothetical protein
MNPLTAAASIMLLLLALNAKMHCVLEYSAELINTHTTSAWRVENMYTGIIKILVSATTTVIIMRVLGLMMGMVVRGLTDNRRYKKSPLYSPIVIYLYHKVNFFKTHNPAIQTSRCAVCLCDGNNDAVLECGHAFHWGCVRPWLDARNTCPLCMREQSRRKIDGMGRVVI